MIENRKLRDSSSKADTLTNSQYFKNKRVSCPSSDQRTDKHIRYSHNQLNDGKSTRNDQHNQLKNKTNGCFSANNFYIPVGYFKNEGESSPFSKEVKLQKKLIKTRHQKAVELLNNMNEFWGEFRKKCKTKLK